MMPPELLAPLPQWLGYRSEWVEERGKYTKKPVSPHDGRPGSSTNSATWGYFQQAMEAVHRHGLDGVGFVLSEQDPYTAIDLDGCRNPETGEIAEWAEKIVDRFRSYTEVSPSGTGLHIIIAGALPVPGRRSGPIEVYHSGRYITVTGNALPGFEEIQERGDELAGWFVETFPASEPQDAVHRESFLSLGDEDVLQKIGSARNSATFLQLYAGDTSGYGGDHSRADQALVSMLAFWTQDPEQLDRLFRSSGLMREKWEQRADYRRRTIERALSGLSETYNPARLSLDNNRHAECHSAPPQVGASTGHTDENETIAALQAQIAELQERVRIADAVAMRAVELESTLQQRDEQLRQCAARNEAMRAVLASTALDPADKVIGLAALTHMNAREGSERHTDPEKGTRVNMQVISRLSGMSSDTVGKRVQKLAEGGLWERSESSWRDPDGGPPITNVWLKADGSLVERTEALAAVALKRTHGGVRVKVLCDVCGSEDVHRISHKECNGCGHKWGAETTPLNPPQPAAACEPQDAALNYTTICEPQDAARDTSTVEAPQAKRVPVVHFQPEPGEGIEEIDIWQGAQPPPNTAICRRVFGQECFAPGCKHQPRYIPVGAG